MLHADTQDPGQIYGLNQTRMVDDSVVTNSPFLNNLIAFWSQDDSSGVSSDASGNGKTLTDNNSVGTGTGLIGSARDYVKASNQFHSRVDEADFRPVGDFTFAGWINPNVVNIVQGILSKNIVNSAGYILQLDNATLQMVISDGVTLDGVPAVGSASASAWNFVVGWHDSTLDTTNAQLNNGSPGSMVIGGIVQDLSQEFQLARRDKNALPFDGRVDQMGFWHRLLIASEKTFLYNGGAGRSFAEMLAYAG